jgi:hypothetical protein
LLLEETLKILVCLIMYTEHTGLNYN